MVKVKRLAPTEKVKRKLFLLSSNQCAFPECKENLFTKDDIYIGNICHIEGALPGSPRYNKNQTEEDRRSVNNLVLMCPNHHKKTDDVSLFSVAKMKEIKNNHEKKAFTNIEIESLANRFANNLIEYKFSPLENYGRLGEIGYDKEFITDVNKFIGKFENVDQGTRCFYAYTLFFSNLTWGEHSFDTRRVIFNAVQTYHANKDEVSNRLDMHISCLIKEGLLNDIDDYEPFKYCYRCIGDNDHEAFFLETIVNNDIVNKAILYNMFETLDFSYFQK